MGVRLIRSNAPQPPAVRHVENTTCNCCGPSSKLRNISVKLQLNLHQNEPFQVTKSQNFLGKGHSPLPGSLFQQHEARTAEILLLYSYGRHIKIAR